MRNSVYAARTGGDAQPPSPNRRSTGTAVRLHPHRSRCADRRPDGEWGGRRRCVVRLPAGHAGRRDFRAVLTARTVGSVRRHVAGGAGSDIVRVMWYPTRPPTHPHRRLYSRVVGYSHTINRQAWESRWQLAPAWSTAVRRRSIVHDGTRRPRPLDAGFVLVAEGATMPQKMWAVGEEVLAANFNTYVQEQVVATFTRPPHATPPFPPPTGSDRGGRRRPLAPPTTVWTTGLSTRSRAAGRAPLRRRDRPVRRDVDDGCVVTVASQPAGKYLGIGVLIARHDDRRGRASRSSSPAAASPPSGKWEVPTLGPRRAWPACRHPPLAVHACGRFGHR